MPKSYFKERKEHLLKERKGCVKHLENIDARISELALMEKRLKEFEVA